MSRSCSSPNEARRKSPGRPIEYDREAVLDSALELFWREGFASTNLRRVLEVTGFNRHSLYAEFDSLEGLFDASLQRYFDKSTEIWSLLESPDANLDSVRQLFRLRLNADLNALGCFAGNTIIERRASGSGGAELAQRYWRRVEDGIAHCIRNAQSEGSVQKSKDARSLAKFVVAVLHGLGPLSKSSLSRAQLNKIADTTLQALRA